MSYNAILSALNIKNQRARNFVVTAIKGGSAIISNGGDNVTIENKGFNLGDNVLFAGNVAIKQNASVEVFYD